MQSRRSTLLNRSVLDSLCFSSGGYAAFRLHSVDPKSNWRGASSVGQRHASHVATPNYHACPQEVEEVLEHENKV